MTAPCIADGNDAVAISRRAGVNESDSRSLAERPSQFAQFTGFSVSPTVYHGIAQTWAESLNFRLLH